MGNDYVREITLLKDRLALAQLRCKRLWFTYEVPDEFIRNRTRSAYDSGFEAGWRGHDYDNPYAPLHYVRAYRQGYRDADTRVRREAAEGGTK